MDIIGEFFVEILFRRIIVGFFGYYTLLGAFKISRSEKGFNWLTEEAEHEGVDFGRGCIIGIVGLLSFAICFSVLAFFCYEIFEL